MDYKTELTAIALSVLSIVLSYVGLWLKEALRKYVSTTRYAQEIGILYDAARQVLARKAQEKKVRYIDMIKDFHLDQREVEEIKLDIMEVANESLKNLRGYIATEGAKRLTDKLDFILGEIQARFLPTAEPQEIGPNDEAVAK